MHAHWYFDVISPFSYLQFLRLGEVADRCDLSLKPVLFAGLLNANGQKGPAEIPSKRLFTYRMVTWLAKRRGIPFTFPDAHPFNPIRALRLCVALDNTPDTVGKIFHAIWGQGHLPDHDQGWRAIQDAVGVADGDTLIASAAVKQAPDEQPASALARRFLRELETLVSARPTVELLARRLGVSTSTLTRNCRNTLGLPAKALVDNGLGAMGHVGLTPQSISVLGGFRPQGRSFETAAQVVERAMELERAGCFAIVIECVPRTVAAAVTAATSVPTIGIGAGDATSGQVLVYHDLLGMMQHPHHAKVTPKFCKQYANVGEVITGALEQFKTEVESGEFPGMSYSPYRVSDEDSNRLVRLLEQKGLDAAAEAVLDCPYREDGGK